MFIVAAVIVVMAIVVWGGLRALRAQVDDKLAPRLGMVANAALVGGLALAGLLAVWSTVVVIPAGYVGVASLFGHVQPHPLSEGLHLINPLLHVTRMST